MLCMFLQSLSCYAHDVDDFSITLLPRGLHIPKSGTARWCDYVAASDGWPVARGRLHRQHVNAQRMLSHAAWLLARGVYKRGTTVLV